MLRVYEEQSPVRTAALLLELSDSLTSRDGLAERWAELWPEERHVVGRRSIRSCLNKGLAMWKLLGAVAISPEDSDVVTILDKDALRLAADNLAIIQDKRGVAIPPGQRHRRPAVPEGLRRAQTALDAQRACTRGPGAGRRRDAPDRESLR